MKKTKKPAKHGRSEKATHRKLSESDLKQVSGGISVDHVARKHLAGVKYEDTTLTTSPGTLYK
jgi:hypothetical protein